MNKKLNYTKKEIAFILKHNIKLVKGYIKIKHTKEFMNVADGLIKGYEFALTMLER